MIHIVPTVPPIFNGLGDYCFQLWRYWPNREVSWTCLATEVPDGAHEAWPQARVIEFKPSYRGLTDALNRASERDENGEPPTVVLHYVGFAYNPKGVPLWLPRALAAWKKRSGGRLIVMFHELYVLGKTRPTSSTFWLKPFARRVMRRLAWLADNWITNCPAYAARIIAETHIGAAPNLAAPNAAPDAASAQIASKGTIIPVGSNIPVSGEVDFERPWPLPGGRLRVVVFGLPNTRLWALTQHENLLRAMVEAGLVESILLLGKAADEEDELRLAPVRERIGPPELWTRRADLPPDELSATLAEQDLAIVYNGPAILTKSSVYASMCIHGVITVTPQASVTTAATPLWKGALSDLPYLPSDRAHPEKCLQTLQDAHAMAELKSRVRDAAQSTLDWPQIAKQWERAVCDSS